MSEYFLYYLLQAFSVFGAGFALWKGGPAERWAALIVIANVAVGYLGKLLAPDSEGLIRLCNDGAAALALLAVTIRYGAPWMGGAMLFYAGQFALHSFYLVTDRPKDYAKVLINNINWNGVIWCLIIGTAMAWRYRSRTARLAAQAAP